MRASQASESDVSYQSIQMLTARIFTDRDLVLVADRGNRVSPDTITIRFGDDLRVTLSSEPNWLRPVVKRLQRLLDLPNGWDSYGAASIQGSVARWAVVFLARLDPTIGSPEIYPTARGGLQLEWDSPEGSLEIALNPGDRLSFFAVFSGDGTEDDGENLTEAQFFRDSLPKVHSLIPRI